MVIAPLVSAVVFNSVVSFKFVVIFSFCCSYPGCETLCRVLYSSAGQSRDVRPTGRLAPPTDVRDRVYIDCTSLTCKQAEDTTTELEISKVYLY